MDEIPRPEPRGDNETGRRFLERLSAARAKAAALAATRAAIFREELAGKGAFAARAMAGFALALFFGWFALLLAMALIAALLSQLFGSVIAGVAATLGLDLVLAAAGAVLGWKALAKVQPFDFPATGSELGKDIQALSAAVAPPPEPQADEDAEDLEARFRLGAE